MARKYISPEDLIVRSEFSTPELEVKAIARLFVIDRTVATVSRQLASLDATERKAFTYQNLKRPSILGPREVDTDLYNVFLPDDVWPEAVYCEFERMNLDRFIDPLFIWTQQNGPAHGIVVRMHIVKIPIDELSYAASMAHYRGVLEEQLRILEELLG